MDENERKALSLTVTFLRRLRGWSQRQLARASGVHKSLIAAYERGRKAPLRSTLERLAAGAGVPPALLDEHLDLARRAVAAVAEAALANAPEPPPARPGAEAGADLAALCRRLCEVSERTASADAREALALAELALKLAGDDPRLAALAWAHVGNARRVAGDLPAAEAAFARSRALRNPPPALEPAEHALLLDLEASLRKDQRRFPEALRLLDEALALAGPARAGRVLLKRAATLELAGDFPAAIEDLRQVLPLVDSDSDRRLACVARFNLAVNLLHLDRPTEALALLPEVRERAEALGNGLDLVRVGWLEARAAAARGRREEALEGLEQVRRELAERRIAYDAALVSLEIAALRLERGETAEVRRLAGEMLWIFEAQGIAREALASLQLFFEAARREVATAEMARAAAGALTDGKGGRGKG